MTPTPKDIDTFEDVNLVAVSGPFELEIIDESPLPHFNPPLPDTFPFCFKEQYIPDNVYFSPLTTLMSSDNTISNTTSTPIVPSTPGVTTISPHVSSVSGAKVLLTTPP